MRGEVVEGVLQVSERCLLAVQATPPSLAVEGDAGVCHPRYGWQSPALYVCDLVEVGFPDLWPEGVDEVEQDPRVLGGIEQHVRGELPTPVACLMFFDEWDS